MNKTQMKIKEKFWKINFPIANSRKVSTLGFIVMVITSLMGCHLFANEANAEDLALLSGKVAYDTSSGTFSVYQEGVEIIKQAYSVVEVDGVAIKSLDYGSRQITFQEVNDAFGSGKKMTVHLQGNGLPDMQQVFYNYAGTNYFLMEVIVEGEGLKSNYLAPLKTSQVYIAEEGNNRFISVPFDNDTFIRYKSQSVDESTTMVSSEVTAFYEDNSRLGLVVGSVEHGTWKTGIEAMGTDNRLSSLEVFGGFTNEEITRDTRSHGYLEGDSIKSPKIFVGLFEDWRFGLEEFGKTNLLAEPAYLSAWNESTPIGWNSWGAMQTELSLEKAKVVVDYFAEELTQFRSGGTAFIDLDSYWDNLIDGGLEGDFGKLVAFANYCKSKGLKPGIYWAPFVDWGKYDRRVEGSTYNYSEVWTKVNGEYHDLDGCRAMDPTHPATQERIKLLMNKFRLCGFEMIKIDFIGHAAVEADDYYNPEITTGMQAFNEGMEFLTDEIGDDMFIYAAISPNFGTNRYVHSRRIACDAYADIDATEYTLNSNTFGWWQSYMYDYIDGDHIVFGNSSLGENRARLASGLINGTLFLGDDFSKEEPWNEKTKSLFQNTDIVRIAQEGESFRPISGSSSQASEIFVQSEDGMEGVIVVLNYTEEEKNYKLELTDLGLENNDSLSAKEIFRDEEVQVVNNTISIKIGSKDAGIFEISKGTDNSIHDKQTKDGAFVFPNPAGEEIHIYNPQQIKEIYVNTMAGELIGMYEIEEGNSFVLNLSNIASGVYLVTVTDQYMEKVTHKIIRR
jgi:hypothetical protein